MDDDCCLWDKQAVDKLRQRVTDFINNDDLELYDEQDLDKIKVDDWPLKRFLIHFAGNEDGAFNGVINNLRWRKESDLKNLKCSYFPQELHRIGAICRLEPDQNGIAILCVRLKVVKKHSAINDLIKLYILYHLKNIDDQADGGKWGLIFDFDGAGVQNVDTDMAKFIVCSLKSYFPSSLAYVFCVDFPWFLKAFWNLVRSWLPQKLNFPIEFISRKQLMANHIPKKFLPQFLGGNNPNLYETVPEGCPQFVDFCVNQLNLSCNQAEKILATYKPFLS